MPLIILLVVVIIVLALALYLVDLLPFPDPPLKNILKALAVLAAILVILGKSGLLGP